MQAYQENISAKVSGVLSPVLGVQVTVTNTATGNPAALYSDNGVTSITQPLVTDETGYFGFRAANGQYTLSFSSAQIKLDPRVVQLYDPADDAPLTQQQGAAPSGASKIGYGQRTVENKLGDFVSVKDEGAVGDGIADDTAAFIQARSAAQEAGLSLYVPTGIYNVNAAQFPDQSTTATQINVVMGPNVKFVGTIVPGDWFSVPCLGHSTGNEYNLITGNYEVSEPSSAFEDPGAPGQYPFGHATRTIECIPTSEFKGNADAQFLHAVGESGVSASLGALNALASMLAGFLGNANAAEFDIDNFAGDLKGLALVLQGVGTFRLDSALKIVRVPYSNQSTTGAGGNWIPPYQFGIFIGNAEQGIVIDQSQVQNPQHAILVKPGPQRAADQPAIALMTPDGNVMFYVRADGFIAPRNSAVVSAFGTNVASPSITGQNATQYLRADGFVQLAGQIIATTGTIAAGSTLLTLDAPYRPNRTVILPVMFNNGAASWLQVTAAGVLTCGLGLGTSAALDLNNISYRLSN